MCGPFNNNPKDDMMTSYGEISTSLETFVRSWRVNDKCEFTEVLPCENNSAIIQTCSILNGTLFQPCHGLIEFKPYYEVCAIEMCNSKSNMSYGCASILDYALACASKGVSIPINNLPSTCVSTCPPGQEYQICGDSCSRSCRDISSNPNCKKRCIPGCRCPAGQALNDNNKCIPLSKCKCVYKDCNYGPSQQIIKPKDGTNSICNLEVCICNGARWDCEQAKVEHLDAINSCEQSYEIIPA
ncbi:hypothetical protein B566_EDAN002707 [Ephemera danica]|nr:hypothetical protein B566_EDAN002707 [Ephemera danica]